MTIKLGRHLYQHIERGAKTTGTHDPDVAMGIYEEQLTIAEYKMVEAFLRWCHENGKTFGHGNYEQRFAEWQKATGWRR